MLEDGDKMRQTEVGKGCILGVQKYDRHSISNKERQEHTFRNLRNISRHTSLYLFNVTGPIEKHLIVQ